MKWIYGLVLGLILVGCQNTVPDNDYNQYLDTKIEEIYGDQLTNYLVFDIVYKSDSANTELQIIDLERKQLNYLKFTQESHDNSEIKAMSNPQITDYTDCNRMFNDLKLSPQMAIDIAVKQNPAFANQAIIALYKPHIGVGNCLNVWQISTRDDLMIVDAATGAITKPEGW
ncbi:hypothetical protein [Herpetosiphon gulosus]|uniref:PepSY domain-containing protein n=1 Tax=Herpetosiphon gulosus TaxID=1973496 RepID=A0ABP9X6D0_9CHLR